MPKLLLSVKKLTLGYGKQAILKNVNFDVNSGDFITVVGANGSGKSTLIKTLLGLLPALSGTVEFHCGLSHTHMGYLPQETRLSSVFPATVEEVVLSGALGRLGYKPCYGKAEYQAMKKSLQRLHISALQKTSFMDLSGGQKQKVLLARALTASSELLVLDEPSNNLDYASREEFYRTLGQLNQQGLTIIMITHDLDARDLIGNKVLALQNGTTVLYPTADYLRSFK